MPEGKDATGLHQERPRQHLLPYQSDSNKYSSLLSLAAITDGRANDQLAGATFINGPNMHWHAFIFNDLVGLQHFAP